MKSGLHCLWTCAESYVYRIYSKIIKILSIQLLRVRFEYSSFTCIWTVFQPTLSPLGPCSPFSPSGPLWPCDEQIVQFNKYFSTGDIFANDNGLLRLVRGNPSDLLSQEHPVNHADKETTAGNLMIICKNIFTACTSEIKDMATRDTKRTETICRGDTAKKEIETSVWLHPAAKLWGATSWWYSDAAECVSLYSMIPWHQNYFQSAITDDIPLSQIHLLELRRLR